MKSLHLIIFMVSCTAFIIALNFWYIRTVLLNADLRGVVVDDILPPEQLAMSHRVRAKRKKAFPPRKAIPTQPAPNDTAAFVEKQTLNHRIAGLNCDRYGGPSQEIAAEMVYWRDIPSDSKYVSPFAKYGKSPKYLTFEPDEGAWNNVRMGMETATVLAQAMGRILVLPPDQNIDRLANNKTDKFSLKDYFHFDSIADEHRSVEIISMEEFMKREAMTGNLRNKYTGKVEFPPNNETKWNGHIWTGREHWLWLRNVTATPIWESYYCVAGIPSEPGPDGVQRLEKLRETIRPTNSSVFLDEYFDNATEVDATPEARLREQLGFRQQLCLYDDELQNERVIHFMGDHYSGARLLVHFYVFIFFENYHQDLWIKRFVRDHLRYIDEIQCAAARVVHAVRQKAIENGDPDGNFDSFHIRRTDFTTFFEATGISAWDIYNNTKDILVENSTIFIATDEEDLTFFDPLRKHYNLLFLKDFTHLIDGVNQNYMGMIDQRIASRGRTFVGAYYSTFTGYINRMRGYHSQKDKLSRWEQGGLDSYFYVPLEYKFAMRNYHGIHEPLWAREFPVGWRDIDHDLPPNAYSSTS